VAGSRRRQQSEATGSPTPVTTEDTGADAWSEDAVLADDVITETEAGPLEEADFEGETDETETETDGDAADETDTDGDAADGDDTDGDAAEEKGK
jgi:hypothetical protein